MSSAPAVQHREIANPTDQIELDFGAYLAARELGLARHTVGGVPDYGFSLDHEMRRRLASMGPVRTFAQLVTSAAVPSLKQQYQMAGVAIGPHQYPEIYAAAEQCADRLGIGIPQVFVYPDARCNAFTIATTDVAPAVVVTTTLVEALEPRELLFVIGHECGHIHNLHGVYQTAFELISNPLAKGILEVAQLTGASPLGLDLAFQAMQTGLRLFFGKWGRCAEVTSDRAGLICCGDETAAVHALAKLTTGGGARLREINIDQYVEQLQAVRGSAMRLQELAMSHPLIPRRIAALRHFTECEVFDVWRPELDRDRPTISKHETDRRCTAVLDIIRGPERAESAITGS